MYDSVGEGIGLLERGAVDHGVDVSSSFVSSRYVVSVGWVVGETEVVDPTPLFHRSWSRSRERPTHEACREKKSGKSFGQ